MIDVVPSNESDLAAASDEQHIPPLSKLDKANDAVDLHRHFVATAGVSIAINDHLQQLLSFFAGIQGIFFNHHKFLGRRSVDL